MSQNDQGCGLERIAIAFVVSIVFLALCFSFHVQVDKWRHDELRKRIEQLEAKK